MAEPATSPVEAFPLYNSTNRVNKDDTESNSPAAATPPLRSTASPSKQLDVRIDVKGAHIIHSEEDSSTPRGENQGGTPSWQQELGDLELDNPEDYQQDSNDIRLPQNKSLVSHMAVDVSIHHLSKTFRNQIKNERERG
jgi:hypothetical protein